MIHLDLEELGALKPNFTLELQKHLGYTLLQDNRTHLDPLGASQHTPLDNRVEHLLTPLEHLLTPLDNQVGCHPTLHSNPCVK